MGILGCSVTCLSLPPCAVWCVPFFGVRCRWFSSQRKKSSVTTFDVAMPGGHRHVADCQNRVSPETSARREVEVIRLLTVEGTEPMRRLWLRKCSHTSRPILYHVTCGGCAAVVPFTAPLVFQ